ncbi:MAG: LacI family DNA-binding transcriptional regulator [Actinomycetaceae bacterium]
MARAAEVHLSTASRVLHSAGDGRRAASSATAERIRRVAKELNYQRDPTAHRLRTGHSLELAVIVPRLSDMVLARMYEGIQDRAGEDGYTTFVANSRDEPELREQLTSSALDRRVAGLIFGDATLDASFLDGLRERSVPFVLVNRRSGDHVSSTSDDHLGGVLVAEHLVARGHERVAVVGGSPWASTGADRCAGFVGRMAELGYPVPSSRIIQNGFDAQSGTTAALQLLDRADPPTAIFALNDFTAIGVMGAVRSTGRAIGHDVAVVGYNDTDLAAVLPVPLTSVRSPMFEIGRSAAKLLINRLDGERVESVVFEPHLMVRESTDPGSTSGPA